VRISTLRRTVPAVLGAVLLGVLVFSPETASATTTTTVNYRCSTTAYGTTYQRADTNYTVTLSAPSAIDNGSSFSIRWSFGATPPSPPIALTGVSMTTDSQLVITRPGHADDVISAPTSSPTTVADIPPSTDLPGPKTFVKRYNFVADSPGDVFQIKPGTIYLDFVTGDDGIAGSEVMCTPVDSAASLASVTVRGAPDPCIAANTCTGTRTFVGDVVPDSLSATTQPDPLNPWPSAITFPASNSQSDAATLRQSDVKLARITDSRTLPLGWDLTASVSDLPTNADGDTLAAINLAIDQISCDSPTGSSGSVPATPGSGGTLDNPVVLCSVEAGDVGPTGAAGGQWDVVGRVSLDVPSFAAAGAYAGTITLTLS